MRPVVEQREDAETLRTYKRLGTDYRDGQPFRPVLETDHLGLDLGLPVRPHALQPVGLVEWMVVGYPVDGRRGDVDETLHAVPERGIEDFAGALDVGGVDV